MKTITINDHNLNDSNIDEYITKVRAVLISDDKILISHYGGVILLPGGSIDNNETDDEAIIRELKEETGIDYDINELEELLMINYYQSNYPTRSGKVINRLVKTKYYIGQFKGINLNNVKRTEKELIDNFTLELISINDLEEITILSTNPRKGYFDRENKEVIKLLK